MEVDLRNEDKKYRYLYFFLIDKWNEIVFNDLPESVRFGVYIYSLIIIIY